MAMDMDVVEVEWADEDGGRLRKPGLGAATQVAFQVVFPDRCFASY